MFFLLTNLLNFYKIYNREKRGVLCEKYLLNYCLKMYVR